MARGYPDYFGQSVFPSYGIYSEHAAQIASIAHTVTGTVFNLSAKAKIYSLYLHVSNIILVAGVNVILTIDNDTLVTQTLNELFEQQWCVERGYPLKLSLYDTIGKRVTFVGASDITIGQSFKLELVNITGGTIWTKGAIHYAQVI